jgi:hypothetical protein
VIDAAPIPEVSGAPGEAAEQILATHLIKSDELATADPAQVISLLRPCMTSLAAAQPPAPPEVVDLS